MAFGSDIYMKAPGHTHGTAAIENLDAWTAADVPAADILRVLTINGARLLGIEASHAGISPGMAADIIATPTNPLEQIEALESVSFVMKSGVIYRDER